MANSTNVPTIWSFLISLRVFCKFSVFLWYFRKDCWDALRAVESALKLPLKNQLFHFLEVLLLPVVILYQETLAYESKRGFYGASPKMRWAASLHKQQCRSDTPGISCLIPGSQLSVVPDCVLTGMTVLLTSSPAYHSPCNWQRLNFSGRRSRAGSCWL